MRLKIKKYNIVKYFLYLKKKTTQKLSHLAQSQSLCCVIRWGQKVALQHL